MAPICRHCGRETANRPRGLGWRCFNNLDIRRLYAPAQPWQYRGVNGGNHGRPLPTPTTAWPGTDEKVAVLAARAEAGQQLFHPHDVTLTVRSVLWLVNQECPA